MLIEEPQCAGFPLLFVSLGNAEQQTMQNSFPFSISLDDIPLVNPPRTQELFANAKSSLVKTDKGQLVSSLPSFYRSPRDASENPRVEAKENTCLLKCNSKQQETRKNPPTL